MYRQVVAPFQEAHPDWNIELVATPWEDYAERLMVMIASGLAPDVILMHDVPGYHTQGLLTDLTPFMARDQSFDPDIYFPFALDSLRYEGKQYGVMVHQSNHVLYYNPDAFAYSGLPVPNDYDARGEWTWDTFVEIGKKLTPWTATDGWVFQITDWLPFLWQNEGDVFSPDGTRSMLDDPRSIEAFEWMVSLQSEHGLVPRPWEGVWMEGFLTGRLAMIPNWPLFSDMTHAQVPWDVTHYPAGRVRATMGGGPGFGILATSEHKDEAWELLKWLVGVEANEMYSAHGYGIPSVMEVAWEWAQMPGEPAHRHVFIEAVNYQKPFPQHPLWSQALRIINLELQDVWMEEKSAREAMIDAARQINGLLAR